MTPSGVLISRPITKILLKERVGRRVEESGEGGKMGRSGGTGEGKVGIRE